MARLTSLVFFQTQPKRIITIKVEWKTKKTCPERHTWNALDLLLFPDHPVDDKLLVSGLFLLDRIQIVSSACGQNRTGPLRKNIQAFPGDENPLPIENVAPVFVGIFSLLIGHHKQASSIIDEKNRKAISFSCPLPAIISSFGTAWKTGRPGSLYPPIIKDTNRFVPLKTIASIVLPKEPPPAELMERTVFSLKDDGSILWASNYTYELNIHNGNGDLVRKIRKDYDRTRISEQNLKK